MTSSRRSCPPATLLPEPRRLTKAEAERVLAAVEQDDPAVLRDTLRSLLAGVLGLVQGTGWAEVVDGASRTGNWPADRRDALMADDPATLEALAVDLNELRRIA